MVEPFRARARRATLLALVCLAAKSAVAGAPLDAAADRVVSDFEGELDWRAQRQNNITAKLDLPQALGHTGQASLKVEIESGVKGPKGRNAVRFVKGFKERQDWSEFEGVQFWLKVVEGGGDVLFCLHAARGVRYRARVMVNPVDEGGWKLHRFPFSGFRWDFESAKTTEPSVDPKAITGISLWRQMGEKQKTVFYLDDVELYRPRQPYDGPGISFSTNLKRALVRPGDDIRVLAAVTRIVPKQKHTVSVRLTDFFGEVLSDKTFDVVPDAKGQFRFETPVSGIGYFRVDAELKSEGKTIYTENYSVGLIPELPEAQKEIDSAMFGIWVGGVQYLVDHGARWYRTYCEPWRFEPDGAGGYRYIGKGAFPRKSMPFRDARPICYFRGMPKWLTSRPDRSDYRKFPPKEWDDYAKFVTWYVGKMKHLIKHWEVWNEPVPYAYWMGKFEEMVKLHEVTYKAVKAADPKAVVMGPCPYSFLFDFLRKFYEQGGGSYIDAVVIHAYTRDAPEPGSLDVNFRKVRDLTAEYIGQKDLYVTELGWDAARVGQTAQAQYLVRAHVMAMEAGVKALLWHMYWDYKGVGPRGYAILNHNRTPRPALVAFCTLMRMLLGTTFSRRLPEFQDPVRAYEFRAPGRKVTVAWCCEGSETVRLPLTASSAEIVNIVGVSRQLQARGGGVQLNLDGNPLYVLETCQ